MDGLLGRSPVVIKEEGRNDGYGAWSGNWIFALVIIFLAVMFIFARRNDGSNNSVLPFEAALLSSQNKHSGCNDWSPADQIAINRQASFVDPEIANMLRDQAIGTGQITHDIDQQTAQLQRSMDQQSCEIERSIGRVVENQNRVALEAERLFQSRALDDKNEKITELRLALAEKESRILHQETLNAIGKSNGELNSRLDQLSGRVETRLVRVEDGMLKRPPFYAAGGVPLVSPCVPSSSFGAQA